MNFFMSSKNECPYFVAYFCTEYLLRICDLNHREQLNFFTTVFHDYPEINTIISITVSLYRRNLNSKSTFQNS